MYPSSVHWHEKNRRNLVAGRGVFEPPTKRSPGRSKLVRDVAKAMMRVMGTGFDDLTVPSDLASALPAALEAARNPDTKAPLSLEQEAISYAIACKIITMNSFTKTPTQSPKLVRKWFHLGGAAFAVRTLTRAVKLTYKGSWQMHEAGDVVNLQEGGALVDVPIGDSRHGNLNYHKRDGVPHALAFRVLRELLANADEAAYAEAVEAGAALRAGASLAQRAWLTFAMPTETAWADEDAAAMLALDEVPATYLLLMDALSDIDQALELHRRQERPHEWALDLLLSRHGAAAAEPLIALAVEAQAENRSLMFWWTLEALAQLPTPEVAKFLVQTYATGSDIVRKSIEPLFQAAPEIALPPLRELAGEHPGLEGALAAVLRANPELDHSAPTLAVMGDLPALLRTPPRGKGPPTADWDLGRLPRLRLVNTESALPPEAVTALGHALHASKGARSPELDEALRIIEPTDKVALADTLWEMWSEGHNQWTVWLAARKWLGLAQGLLGDDDVARRIAAEISGWTGQRFNPAKACIAALQTLGTPVSLQQLHELARTANSKGIKKAANKALQAVAAERGITTEALIDSWTSTA